MVCSQKRFTRITFVGISGARVPKWGQDTGTRFSPALNILGESSDGGVSFQPAQKFGRLPSRRRILRHRCTVRPRCAPAPLSMCVVVVVCLFCWTAAFGISVASFDISSVSLASCGKCEGKCGLSAPSLLFAGIPHTWVHSVCGLHSSTPESKQWWYGSNDREIKKSTPTSDKLQVDVDMRRKKLPSPSSCIAVLRGRQDKEKSSASTATRSRTSAGQHNCV